MDLGEKDTCDVEKKSNDDSLKCNSSNWQFGDDNQLNPSMNGVPMKESVASGEGDIPISTSGLIIDSYCPNIWSHQNAQGLGCEVSDIGVSTSASLTVAPVEGNPTGNGYLQAASEMLPQTLSEFPADTAFIERAARFSSFNGGSFSEMLNSFSMPESRIPYTQDGLNSALGFRPQNHNVVGSVDHGGAEVNLGHQGVVGYITPNEESLNECKMSCEPKVSGGRQVVPSTLGAGGLSSSSKGHNAKKRRRSDQVAENDRSEGVAQVQGDTAKDDCDSKQKNDRNPTTTGKAVASKNGKDIAQNSDGAKEDYIHVRARRGQATNSHSLAERVRREKISERMKFLQDLVPGCNKVTGKAVMLDEIINYVQSLQRQVEFLSMKLSTVNPQIDLNIEALIAKDMQRSQGGPSMFPFLPDANMVHAQLHPSHQGLVQAGMTSAGNPMDSLRRPINPQLMTMNGGVYKDSNQMTNMWDDELNNTLAINFGNNIPPFTSQDPNGSGSHQSDHMKVEL
ncbi:hypothetical protein ACHQM5_008808 [Ranunculus cassubicifolius]